MIFQRSICFVEKKNIRFSNFFSHLRRGFHLYGCEIHSTWCSHRTLISIFSQITYSFFQFAWLGLLELIFILIIVILAIVAVVGLSAYAQSAAIGIVGIIIILVVAIIGCLLMVCSFSLKCAGCRRMNLFRF